MAGQTPQAAKPRGLFRLSARMMVVGIVVVVSMMAGSVMGNTPLSDEFVQNDLRTNNGFEIAFASRPMFHFGQSRNNPPCYPTSAFSPLTHKQHGVPPTPWPDASTGCPKLPPAQGLEGPPFPVYYTVTLCGAHELRVVYNVYFQRDGWSNVVLARGHEHDWERVIVVWTRLSPGDSEGSSPGLYWRRTTLLTSHHSGYDATAWGDVQNTFAHGNHSENGGRDKDGAKIYVGWGKHAMYLTRNTGWNDPASQGCAREFRSRDWWFMPRGREELVWAGKGVGGVGGRIEEVAWGKAGSTPLRVEGGVCAKREGGYVVCGMERGEGERGGEL